MGRLQFHYTLIFIIDPQLEERISCAEQQGDLVCQLSSTIFDGLDMTGHKKTIASALKSTVWSILEDMPFPLSEYESKLQGNITNQVGISSELTLG